MTASQIIALAIFVAVIAVIVSEKLHRAACALIGAVLLILIGILEPHEALGFIDFNTIGVLIGMMMFVAVVKNSGIFEYLAVKSAKIAKGNPWKIMVYFMIITAVLSAFLDNVTTVLLIGPMTFSICKTLELNPIPYLMTQIIASNVGGTGTLIGDPPNIIIGTTLRFGFSDFILNTGPIALVSLIASIALFYAGYHKRLLVKMKSHKIHAKNADGQITYPEPSDAIKDRKSFIISCLIFAAAVVLLVSHEHTHLTVATIGVFIGLVSLLSAGKHAKELIHNIDTKTIYFFIGLFMVVGGLELVGVLNLIADAISSMSSGHAFVTVVLVLAISALASAFVDNIPFAATMIPVIKMLAQVESMPLATLAWALSVGTDIGGSATPIGASANVVGISVAARHGYIITWKKYCKAAVPATLMVIVIATVIIYLRYFLFA